MKPNTKGIRTEASNPTGHTQSLIIKMDLEASICRIQIDINLFKKAS
jgi:hypothetical protein